MSIFSNGQNGSSDTINPVESGKIVIETVTAINAGGRIGVHQTSCTSDGGIKIDIWYAVATIFAEEWFMDDRIEFIYKFHHRISICLRGKIT